MRNTSSFLIAPAHAGNPPRFVRCGHEDAIKATLRAALLTRKGERPHSPELGSRVGDLLFRPVVGATLSEIAYAAREAIENAENRIEILELDVNPDPQDRCRVILSLMYRVKATNKTEKVQLALSP